MSTNVETRTQRTHSEKHGYKLHILTFVLSIILTVLAFIGIAVDAVPKGFAIPFMIGLAIVQAAFQAAYWMHLNQKGHEFPITFILSAFFCSTITVLACVGLIWW
ncbi:cytochrome C oxidase subunit IV family protein [Brevibacillus marinus]|uniref:cytochrome C oxidase subunit IV family protein n=1 Tax=Brevibacillus marinus TaxID=2496837 RepID=UPI000F8348B8|nr:cytochrome C oxidase subunit IV family protein [Brevibacillus marinus]